jgi:thiol:disulfide interchange protein DsbC
LATAFAAIVSFPSAAADASDQVKAQAKKQFPDMTVESVRKVPYGELYELNTGSEIVYTDEKVSYFLIGSLVDTKTRQNMTEARTKQINMVKFENLPLEHAIKIQRGDGSRKVAIFEDPNCGYCKKFERDLLAVSDISVYVFLYPILAADSMDKSKAVWCSADQGKAWLDLMLKNAQPAVADAKCDATPVEKSLAFGRSKRVSGTPTIIFEDGDRIPGAMTREQFEKKLASLKPTKAAANTGK